MIIKNIAYTALATLQLTAISQAEEVTKSDSNADDKKHVTIIVGTHHYSPQRSMPELKKELERLGFEVALINPDWNPEKDKRGLPGLEVLEKTDLAVFFTRWLKLEGQQYDQMMGYVKAGKPVVGLRTANHGFNYPKDNPKSELNVGFGKDVLGTPYLIHLKGSTKINITEGQENHPILTGVSGTWSSPGTLYLSDIQEGVQPILQGTGNSKRVGKVENMYGTHELQSTMTDNIAWTWTNKHGGKTFYTSLGHEADFGNPKSMRVMVNGIHWAAGTDIPSADTEIKIFSTKSKKKKATK